VQKIISGGKGAGNELDSNNIISKVIEGLNQFLIQIELKNDSKVFPVLLDRNFYKDRMRIYKILMILVENSIIEGINSFSVDKNGVKTQKIIFFNNLGDIRIKKPVLFFSKFKTINLNNKRDQIYMYNSHFSSILPVLAKNKQS
jgi:hypothetical protein